MARERHPAYNLELKQTTVWADLDSNEGWYYLGRTLVMRFPSISPHGFYFSRVFHDSHEGRWFLRGSFAENDDFGQAADSGFHDRFGIAREFIQVPPDQVVALAVRVGRLDSFPPEIHGKADEELLAAAVPLPELLTLDQAAALVNRSTRSLERYKRRGMPKPRVLGGGGKPHEYPWPEMREWLSKTFDRPIPVESIDRFKHTKQPARH
jgi:hypothetical protein